jgi:hypothetical protein
MLYILCSWGRKWKFIAWNSLVCPGAGSWNPNIIKAPAPTKSTAPWDSSSTTLSDLEKNIATQYSKALESNWVGEKKTDEFVVHLVSPLEHKEVSRRLSQHRFHLVLLLRQRVNPEDQGKRKRTEVYQYIWFEKPFPTISLPRLSLSTPRACYGLTSFTFNFYIIFSFYSFFQIYLFSSSLLS